MPSNASTRAKGKGEKTLMRVLVTGGAGYIGSHTAKALAGEGFEPVTIDNLVTGHRWAVRWGPFVQGDVGDAELMRQVLRDYRIEAVIHFAASAYVGESVQNPREYFHNNVANTLALLGAMLDAGLDRIVFSSTCATYGVPETSPISEDCPQRPVNPYGESKVFIERVLRAYDHAYDLHSVSLRYFNAAGADADGEIGEEHVPETHLIPLVIEAALGQRPWVEVFGTDYPTRDGTAIRDFVHVADLADAHVRALGHLLNGGKCVALNLGTGTGHSVREVIAMVESVGGRPVPVREAPQRAGDPPALVADARRGQSVLGWHPQYADLDVIVQTAWDWYANVRAGQPDIARP
jgi:UDP-glucose-4-epimerase GalE